MAGPAEVYRYPDGQAAEAGQEAQPKQPAPDEGFKPHDDPLLGCLQFLARHYERPASATMLTAGLPLEEGKLSRPLFTRAARRIGLTAEPVRRSLADLTALDCPALILLRDGRPLVLLSPVQDETCDVL